MAVYRLPSPFEKYAFTPCRRGAQFRYQGIQFCHVCLTQCRGSLRTFIRNLDRNNLTFTLHRNRSVVGQRAPGIFHALDAVNLLQIKVVDEFVLPGALEKNPDENVAVAFHPQKTISIATEGLPLAELAIAAAAI